MTRACLAIALCAAAQVAFAEVPFLQGVPYSGACVAPTYLRGFSADGTPQCGARSSDIASTVRHLHVPPSLFKRLGNLQPWMHDQGVIRRMSGQAPSVSAALRLPTGGLLDQVSCQIKDNNAGGALTLHLFTVSASGVEFCRSGVISSDSTSPARLVVTPTAAACAQPVDNDLSSATFRVFGVSVDSSTTVTYPPPAADDLALFRCDATYRVTSVLP